MTHNCVTSRVDHASRFPAPNLRVANFAIHRTPKECYTQRNSNDSEHPCPEWIIRPRRHKKGAESRECNADAADIRGKRQQLGPWCELQGVVDHKGGKAYATGE